MTQSKSRINLLDGLVGRTLLRLAGPMVLGLVAVILFNVVDTFWVGRLGAHELAAMSFTFPVVFLLMSLSVGMGVGVTAAVSPLIGKGDIQRVCRLTTDGLIFANTLVLILAVTGLLTIAPVFRSLGASAEMIRLIRSYIAPWYLGIGFIVIPIVGNAAIRATGDTKTPSMVMIIAGGVNMVLDPLLIFGPGPFPRLELQGAAIATVISYAITFFASLWILWKRERMLDFSRPQTRDVFNSWSRILYVGLPAAGTQMLVPLGAGIITRITSWFGPEAVAAFGVGSRIESLAMIPAMALASSLTPFVGQNLGARKSERVRTALHFAKRAVLLYGAAVAGVLALMAWPLASLFSVDATVVDIARWYLYTVPVSYGFLGLMFALNSTFNAARQPMKSAFLIAMRLFVFAVPLGLAGAVLFGIRGLFLGISAANVLVGVLAVLLGRRLLRTVQERVGRQHP